MVNGDSKPRMLSIDLFQIGHSNMIPIVYFLFIREKCSTDTNKKKMTQITKAQRGALI